MGDPGQEYYCSRRVELQAGAGLVRRNQIVKLKTTPASSIAGNGRWGCRNGILMVFINGRELA
jgi:hypothetical protein